MFVLAVDYDGTVFSGAYPEKGDPVQDVIDKVKEFQNVESCETVLWTCREGKSLEEAVKRCEEVGLKFDAINDNTSSVHEWIAAEAKESGDTFASRKIFADYYVDDRAHNIDLFLTIDVKATCTLKEKNATDESEIMVNED